MTRRRLPGHPSWSRRNLLWVSPFVLFLTALPAAAQDSAGALQKSQIIRMLAERTRTDGELAALILGRCVGFRPTARDIEDFRSLGAGAIVIRAIRECGTDEASTDLPPLEEPSPSDRAAAPPSNRGRRAPRPTAGQEESDRPILSLAPRHIVTAPGRGTEVTAEVTSGGEPAGGVSLVLREDGRLRAAAETDTSGRVTFRVPSAYRPGQVRRFSISGLSESLAGDSVVEVETVVEEESESDG